MTKSKLTNITILSPNHSGKRRYKVSRITIHHMAGNLTVEQCGAVFKNPTRQASSNYGIGTDGRIACYVDENNRAWTTGSDDNDNRAITIEVANNRVGEPWSISNKAYKSLIALCADICDRYGINPEYTGKQTGTLNEHRMFAATACPGTYIHNLQVTHQIERDIKKAMKKGQPQWKKNSTGWWYERADGTYPKNEWEKINGKWYHFNSKGYMQTGWVCIKNKWYYLKSSGEMATGTTTGIKATFDKNGALTEG